VNIADPAGSGSHTQTFGRRSRVEQKNAATSHDDYVDDYDNNDDDIDREVSFKKERVQATEQASAVEGGVREALTNSLYQKDVIDPKVID